MQKILVLGCGLVGRHIAFDLTSDFDVTATDISTQNLCNEAFGNKVKMIHEDLSNVESLKYLIGEFDMVVNALPGYMGYKTLKTIIESGKDVIDISFFPEDPFDLDALAKEKDVTAIMDFGVAPGMSHLLSGYAANQLDTLENLEIYVGGLPKKREKPWEYKTVFSPVDVIEEYTRKARFVNNGKIVEREALTDLEIKEFPVIGQLEAFNSDGLRSLIKTIDCPNMIEKTLRYPGYVDKIAALKDSGFFREEKTEVDGKMISPMEFTSKLLFDSWKLKEGDEDITVMQVIAQGIKNDRNTHLQWDLYDEYDPKRKAHSMARTTGYTATMGVRMLANKLFTEKGVFAPEMLGKDEKIVDFILKGLAERNIIYNLTEQQMPW
jgi:lysine 6-dehydrogenase